MLSLRKSLGFSGSPMADGLGWLAGGGDFAMVTAGQGLPEPPVIFYGEVCNVVNGSNQRLVSGTLVAARQPSDAGPTLAVSTELADISGQFSYLLTIPCETILATMSASNRTYVLQRADSRLPQAQPRHGVFTP